jgi:hypothetical protein
MGESYFYFRAVFGAKTAGGKTRKLRRLLKRFFELEERWQKIRDETARGVRDRWEGLKREFPETKWLLVPEREISEEDRAMNFLAGEIPHPIRDELEVFECGGEAWAAALTWHLASWDALMLWAFAEGASEAGWINAEYVEEEEAWYHYYDEDLFDAVPLEKPEDFILRLKPTVREKAYLLLKDRLDEQKRAKIMAEIL